nr:hypothetical protein [Tanacetum cinerariifolium]
MGKEDDAGLVVTESSGIESEVQDNNSRSGNDTDADDEISDPYMTKSQWLRNRNKPVDQKSHTQIPSRQIFTGHRFSLKKLPLCMRKHLLDLILGGNPWVESSNLLVLGGFLQEKLFDSCTSKVDNEPIHGSNVDIPNMHESKQTLDLSARTSINVQKEQSLDFSADSTSSTLTLPTIVTADENFDL